MTFGYVIGATLIAVMIWLGNGVRRIGLVSVGEKIAERHRTALLLVDLQRVFWERGPYAEAAKETAKIAILKEIEVARVRNHPVVAVRQEWSIPSTKAVARLTMKGQALEGSDGVELATEFSSLPDYVIVKRVQDAFETGELDSLLKRLGVGKLRIVGLDLNYCVQKTALAARNRGYSVTVVKAGTLSAASTEGAEKRMSSSGVAIS